MAIRRIRRMLADAGVYVEPDAISLDRSGDRIQVAFVYDMAGKKGLGVEPTLAQYPLPVPLND